jgi:glyoxylase-like metal-dependent hydrolase (beta-lactamase superfamily II)
LNPPALPQGMHFFERGWLSCNQLLLDDGDESVLIDSGHLHHAPQTLSLVQQTIGPRALSRLLNTHLHSDHCGGNAALQQAWSGLVVGVPSGSFDAARHWDEAALSYAPTGQRCARFVPDEALHPGSELKLAGRHWQVHAAPGHDPLSLLFFEPESAVLVSADALWAQGFGVVFPELEGEQAFAEVAATLDLIERLQPRVVVPGHGPLVVDLAAALRLARERLAAFVASPATHRRHATQVLLKYHLLEVQREPLRELRRWVRSTPLLRHLLLGGGAGLSSASEAASPSAPVHSRDGTQSAPQDDAQDGLRDDAQHTVLDEALEEALRALQRKAAIQRGADWVANA